MAHRRAMTNKELLDLFDHIELQKQDQEISGDEGNSSAPDSVDSLVEAAYSEGMCAVMDIM